MSRAGILLALALAGAAGCNRGDAAPAVPAHAADGVCAEHGVLEAVCTKCNPSLAAVFKAKGDWCAEHGFPESICPLCHPERRGRPGAAVGNEDAPPDGTKVRLKAKETAQRAGIAVGRVEERPRRTRLVATARIAYDAARVAQVNARSPGVVRAIRADVGTAVKPGAALAVLESAGVGADQSRVQAARTRVEVAQANHERASRLHREGIAAEREVLAARQEADAAKAELAAAQASLGMVGAAGEGGASYTLCAPIGGVVTERRATAGRLVGTEEILFEIVDTATMWAELDLPESDLARVAVGQAVSLAVDGLPGREIAGTLSYVAPAIDPRTRTARGRVPLSNPDGALRAHLFGRATIEVRDERKVLSVPRAAVQRARGAALVFVRVSEVLFEARRVRVGEADEDRVEVEGRLAPGDEVVTEGGFLLKTETLKGSIGAGCCDVDEAKR